MLEHGGNLNEAVRMYGRPRAEWLDLSTGINPHAYPVPSLPADAWHRLPEPDAGLVEAAMDYYRAPSILPVAGTQAAIQAFPLLRGTSRVVVAAPAYAEHAHCWQRAGHAMHEVAYEELNAAVDSCDVMVVCNPNNPTGATVDPETLLRWADVLAARGGWLVVDEAFCDTTPQSSIAFASNRPGLIVLRSVGKFFGLAGARLGFVAAEQELLKRLADHLGPWSVSGPAQQIGRTALADTRWQATMREHLLKAGERLRYLLAANGIETSGSALYRWWLEENAEAFRRHMAGHGIWVRLFTRGAGGIRVGLPADEIGWQCLADALEEWHAKERP
jgi:cobalamin biosynthetic protein CobC